MKVLVALLIASVVVVSAIPTEHPDWEKFQGFMAKYGKKYDSDMEMFQRFAVFKDNLAAYAKYQAANPKATFGVNKFSDLSEGEFRTRYLGARLPENFQEIAQFGPICNPSPKTGDMPSDYDWRQHDGVTNVKNQEQCGSCWAFSTTENIESVWHLAGNKMEILAPQQIVDCDNTDDGCGGGWTYDAMDYVQKAGGLEGESEYPYTARDGTCKFVKSEVKASIKSHCFVTNTQNETQIKEFTATTAPPSVCVDASSWSGYTGGILSNCGQSIDHCVQITGYGEDNGTPYWWVRNSWGTGWGLDGYLKVERNNDVCAIAQVVTSVIV